MAGEVPSSALVGRAVELHRLDAVLERAGQGSPQVVLVAGDAGVGKTRLLLALADRARRRGMRVLMGASVELGDIGLPYLPVVDALRELADDPEEAGLLTGAAMTAPVLGRLLPGIEPAGLAGGDLDQLQVLDAVRAVLVGLAERSPVVLVLEDLHWADRATRDLVAFLARTLRSGRVTVAVSYRPDELHRRHPLRPLLAELVRLPAVERLELAPFTRVELAEHLEATAGAPLSPDRLEDILARSEGNPFYAEQLLAAGAADARVELPATLAEVLLARVQGLSEPAQRVLRVAAVVGRRVPHRLLAGVAGQPEAELEEGLQEAVSARVLTADGTTGSYAFRHALLQEAVYGDLLPGEQVRLHAACARLLAAEPGGAAAELAHHCLASHDLVGALAASVRAAEEAEAVLAPAEALRHLANALRLWERVPEPAAAAGVDRVELTLRAAAAASAAGDPQRAASLAQDAARAAAETADPERAARAYERLGLYLYAAGRVEEALAARAQAVELVPARPPTRLRARVTAAVAMALIDAARPAEARRWCDEALAAARGAGSADEEADVLITLGVIEQYDDPVKACSLFAAGRAQAAGARQPRDRAAGPVRPRRGVEPARGPGDRVRRRRRGHRGGRPDRPVHDRDPPAPGAAQGPLPQRWLGPVRAAARGRPGADDPGRRPGGRPGARGAGGPGTTRRPGAAAAARRAGRPRSGPRPGRRRLGDRAGRLAGRPGRGQVGHPPRPGRRRPGRDLRPGAGGCLGRHERPLGRGRPGRAGPCRRRHRDPGRRHRGRTGAPRAGQGRRRAGAGDRPGP
jgi:tetratricopeptide (TPR) repeat protein